MLDLLQRLKIRVVGLHLQSFEFFRPALLCAIPSVIYILYNYATYFI
jgi:hypothetical protein